MTKNLIDALADRFLSWPLPKDFAPDCHISFKMPDPVLNPNPTWPVGTNLLTADQARQMFASALESVVSDAECWRMGRMLGLISDNEVQRISFALGNRPDPASGAVPVQGNGK